MASAAGKAGGAFEEHLIACQGEHAFIHMCSVQFILKASSEVGRVAIAVL